MELNLTSPSPSYPLTGSQGSYYCGISVTDVALGAFTLFICLCGLIGNGAVLWLLGFHIRRNPITVYILNLAVADFTFVLFMVATSVLFLLDEVLCSIVVPLVYPRSFILMSLFSYNMGLYLLTAISMERCSSILFPLWYRCRRPQHLSCVVCALLWALSISVIVVVASLCLFQHHEHCWVAVISMYALNFLIFAPPMVISNVILFIRVLSGSKRRQPKRLYIVIFLTVLFFLIFGVPLSFWNFLRLLHHTTTNTQVLFLLACINSSINPFIYFLVGSGCRHWSITSFKVAFRRVFEETGVTKVTS